MKNMTAIPSSPTRGPADHAVREQIIAAAGEHFQHYGYAKTTVSDLARQIGFSKAYIYRFFESKQAIGEAICANCLEGLYDQVRAAVDDGQDATDKLRRFAKTVTAVGSELFFRDRRIYDIASHASAEKWPAARAYNQNLHGLIEEIVREGRASGDFEKKTPLDETCRSICYAFMPFTDPVVLERSLDLLPDAQVEVTSLVLRSLAP
jgi:AcrR family transcriptional regulator